MHWLLPSYSGVVTKGARSRSLHGHADLTRPIGKKQGLLERGGRVRPRVVADVTGDTLKKAIRENVDKSSRILTDEWSGYRGIGKEYAGGHETVRHSSYEYVRATYTRTR
jgi:hypothetical protein